MRDNTNFVYPSKFEQKANFVYTKLDEIALFLKELEEAFQALWE